ncbi:MAG TPA: hypothetical protein QF456_02270 [Nitrosopumilus sp.]|mgnify:CR=1 FL=1|jgi:hypothetical protein|nr:hypothetical protein [Nitrosopumilus sp.]HJM79509.1 hypothetical protein [Nitrosopumilus sp.]
MNPKIFVGIAVAILFVILGGILVMGPTMVVPTPGNNNSNENVGTIEELTVELTDVSVLKISERSATLEIGFEVFNPNPRAVIVQTLDYNLFETGFSNYEQIDGGTIGSRPEGMVEFSSNYYTLLGDNSIILKKKMTLKASESPGELWDALESEYENGESGNASWRVTGTVYYNLSSMTSGQENSLSFEFFR